MFKPELFRTIRHLPHVRVAEAPYADDDSGPITPFYHPGCECVGFGYAIDRSRKYLYVLRSDLATPDIVPCDDAECIDAEALVTSGVHVPPTKRTMRPDKSEALRWETWATYWRARQKIEQNDFANLSFRFDENFVVLNENSIEWFRDVRHYRFLRMEIAPRYDHWRPNSWRDREIVGVSHGGSHQRMLYLRTDGDIDGFKLPTTPRGKSGIVAPNVVAGKPSRKPGYRVVDAYPRAADIDAHNQSKLFWATARNSKRGKQ